MHIKFRFLWIILILALLIPSSTSFAQSTISLRINSVEVKEEQDYLNLNVFFTFFDNATGKPATSATAKSAKITDIDSNTTISTDAVKAETPFYILLVLDTSSSMATAAKDMKKAAADALKNPPANAQFAIMEFNDQSSLIHDFTSNVDVAATAIGKIVIQANKGTCLYDAVWDGIDFLNKTQVGRRALVLFTDGRDEPRYGGGQCSKHGYDQVVAFAALPTVRVPISTIGLSGSNRNINASELENMASTTGGFSAVGSLEDLTESFRTIMNGLANQMMVQGKLYPTKGKHNAVIQVSLGDGTPLTATVPFESTKDYYIPPEPVNINVDGVEFDPAARNYQVNLSIISPQLIKTLRVSIWDQKSGTKVVEKSFTDLDQKPSFVMPAESLTAKHEYEMRFSPVDANERPIKNAKDEPIQLVHPFTYDPEIANTKMTVTSIAILEQDLQIKLQVENPNLVARYEGWLKDESTNAQVTDSLFSSPTIPTDSILHLPLTSIKAGKYTLVLRALNKDNQQLTSTEYSGIVYTPTAAVSLSAFQKLATGLLNRPWIIALILLVFGASIYLIVWLVKKNRQQTGTPVLQGQMEAILDDDNSLPINRTIQSTRKNKVPPPAKDDGATRLVAKSDLPQSRLKVHSTPDRNLIGKIVVLQPLPFTIGSNPDCQLNIKGDSSISAHHAQIFYDPAQKHFLIVDLQSENGVRLNGARIPPNQPAILLVGMMITLGHDTSILFT